MALPPKELFVRWMQANVFMPAMQFSFVPWQYDQEVREVVPLKMNSHCYKNFSRHPHQMSKCMMERFRESNIDFYRI